MKRILLFAVLSAGAYGLWRSGVLAWKSGTYDDLMRRCDAAKRAGDYPAMEKALQGALERGPGDEYAWRSLAWAQGRQGKWKVSLGNARENLRRHGPSGWALAQLAESALGSGDLDLARKTLAEAAALPPAAESGAEEALAEARRRLQASTETRTYRVRFTRSLKAGTPAFVLMPQLKTELQTFTYAVRSPHAVRERRIGVRDYLEVSGPAGEPLVVEGTAVLRPFHLGQERLDAVPPGEAPAGMKDLLGRFENGSWWDPGHPEVQALARALKGRTGAETVQNVLDWFSKNIRYDASIQDDPALGQQGTILKLRRGGCHHNSGLFVTLCRAAGVPACVAHVFWLKGDETLSSVGHGAAEVYLDTIGWVLVEPTDPDSLRLLTAGHAYLSLGPSNRSPDGHHFAERIRFDGKDFPHIVAFEEFRAERLPAP